MLPDDMNWPKEAGAGIDAALETGANCADAPRALSNPNGIIGSLFVIWPVDSS